MYDYQREKERRLLRESFLCTSVENWRYARFTSSGQLRFALFSEQVGLSLINETGLTDFSNDDRIHEILILFQLIVSKFEYGESYSGCPQRDARPKFNRTKELSNSPEAVCEKGSNFHSSISLS